LPKVAMPRPSAANQRAKSKKAGAYHPRLFRISSPMLGRA
jgi:hypothetical protein